MKKRITIDLAKEQWESLERWAKDDDYESLTDLVEWIVYSYAPPVDVDPDAVVGADD